MAFVHKMLPSSTPNSAKCHPTNSVPTKSFVDNNDLRTAFASRMSQMYKAEVPLYGDLMRIVGEVNTEIMTQNPSISNDSPERLGLERHGAIRLGSPHELRTIRRIFEVLGMYAVEYYDLSVAGLPMHATCFRPVKAGDLDRNPFRVFTTLLRPELLQSDEARNLAQTLLHRRSIFSPALLQWLDVIDHQAGHLSENQIEPFISEALLTFSWKPVAAATLDEYLTLKEEHPILADIACFSSAHINHLTPRVLDIEAADKAMRNEGMEIKDHIEGPPKREIPILLRQTSFLALQEKVQFVTKNTTRNQEERIIGLEVGHHKARFGEIEERGCALTPKGRALYDHLHAQAMTEAAKCATSEDKTWVRGKIFEAFPDSWPELVKQELVYYQYRLNPSFNLSETSRTYLIPVHELVEKGILETLPITYEDFLPFSAAGIFQSNLSNDRKRDSIQGVDIEMTGDRVGFEKALGCEVRDSGELYEAVQRESLRGCLGELRGGWGV